MKKRDKLLLFTNCSQLFTFISSFDVVVDSLAELELNSDSKARAFRCSILKFEFIVALVAAESILQYVVPLSKMLQRIDNDLVTAAKESRVVIDTLTELRTRDEAWDKLHTKATKLAETFDVQPTMPRLTGRQTHRSNVPAADPKEYLKLSLFYPFLDHLLSELETRLVYPSDRFSAQYLVPSNLHKLNPEIAANLFVPFASDISDEMAALQESELSRWKTKWQGQDDIPYSICETLRHANTDLYPNISVALTVLLTMPISSATAERSFSAMRRIKNYMRSTMNEERLSGLALMHIHRDFAIDVDAVLKKFASDGNRRIALAFSY